MCSISTGLDIGTTDAAETLLRRYGYYQCSWESGWPTERAAREHEAQGRRLYDIVSGLLPDGDSLRLDLWETDRRTGL